jgi:membrane associated rhomboid family serine protease
VIPLKGDSPLERVPLVTLGIIALNVAAFLWQIGAPHLVEVAASGKDVVAYAQQQLAGSILRGGAIPYEILTFTDTWPPSLVPPPITLVTSMFLHGGVVHLASNMLFLWVFGKGVEDALGRRRCVVFYLAAGFAAALLQTAASAASGDVQIPMVGASGAIAGVLAAYVSLFPRARLVQRVRIPASLLIALWFLLQVFSAVFGGAPGVAFVAHVGGFVAGWLLVRAFGRRPAWRARAA